MGALANDLFDWLRAHGARFPGARVHVFPGMGRGLVARRRLVDDEPVLLVPRDVWFTRKTAHTQYRPLLDRAQEAGVFSHSMSRLALLLALEHATPDSFFRVYLDALGSPTVPYALTPEERAACQGLPVLAWIDEQHATTEQETQRLRSVLGGHDALGDLEVDAWRWAYGHVMQRTFSVDLEDEEVWVLIPGMDLCNHDTMPNTRYFAEDEGWLLEAARTVEAGEQLTIQYGRSKTSTDLFLYYGFVPPRNAHDRIRLQLQLADDDPDRTEKQAAIELLGLSAEALVGSDGAVPSAFLHAAILWSLDARSFRAPAPDVESPDRAAAALGSIADAMEAARRALATSIDDDEGLLASPLSGWLPAIVTYRRNAKAVLRDASAALRARIENVQTDGWRPQDVVASDDDGRYGMLDVVVTV